jgi:hypothetical protein
MSQQDYFSPVNGSSLLSLTVNKLHHPDQTNISHLLEIHPPSLRFLPIATEQSVGGEDPFDTITPVVISGS